MKIHNRGTMNYVLKAALEYVFEHGMSVVPVNGKKPIEKWQVYRERYPTEQELKTWFADVRYNIALVCGEISNTTVLDADSEAAEQWIYEHTETERVVETGRGRIHAHFQYLAYPNKINLFGIGLDVRSGGALAVVPPSKSENMYSWIQFGERGMLSLPEEKPIQRGQIQKGGAERAIKYLEKLEPAVSGQGGHKRMFRAACVVRQFVPDWQPEEAVEILKTFNERCLPPFTEAELLHKVKSAWNQK